MVQIDHIAIVAKNPGSAAYRLAEILGLPAPTPDGADGDMYRLDLAHGAFILFNPAAQIDFTHVAFRVSREQFDATVGRIKRLGIPFGNEPDDTQNGKTEDPLGSAGRIYFVGEDGHLFEVTC